MYTQCLICHRPLKNPVSMEKGMGPVCASKGDKSDNDNPTLATITKPMVFDVELYRDTEDDFSDPVQTNVPWSVIQHSPTGFNWGYGGSGPADLALNILNAFIPPGTDGEPPVNCYQGKCSETAWSLHQEFKREFLAGMETEGGTIKAETIQKWIAEKAA